MRTSSTPTILATSTRSIQSSKASVATALLPSSSSSLAQPQPDAGLATGAKAGIAVGVSSGALIIVVILFLLGRERSSGKLVVLPPPAVKPSAVSDNNGGKAELAGSEAVEGARLGVIEKAKLPANYLKGDLKGNKIVEDRKDVGELDGSRKEEEQEVFELASP